MTTPQDFLRTSVVFTVFALLVAGEAYGQGDGPRSYYPAPLGTNLITVIGLSIDSNQSVDHALVIPSSKIEVETGVLQYTKVTQVGGKPAGLLGIIPYGKVSGSLFGSGALTIDGEDSGIGDAGVGVVVGMAGLPVLTPKQYVGYDPTYQFGVMARFG